MRRPLKYDGQIRPRDAIRRFLDHHDTALIQAAEEILTLPLTTNSQTYQQAVFPIPDGGLGLETNNDRRTTQFLSSLLNDLPTLIRECYKHGHYHTDILNTTGHLAEGIRCQQQLQSEGIYIDHYGQPTTEPPQQLLDVTKSVTMLVKKRYGRWRRLLMQNRKQRLPHNLRTIMEEASGAMSSQWILATEGPGLEVLDNYE